MMVLLTAIITICAPLAPPTCARFIMYLRANNSGQAHNVSRDIAAAAACACHGEVLDVWFLAARGVIEVTLFDNTLGRSCRPLFIGVGGKQSWRPLERGRLHF